MKPIRILILLAAGALAPMACADGPYAVAFEGNVAMVTRDGVTLRADIYRPKAEGTFPVLLERTPYNKFSNIESGLKGAARGYVVILQDVRGRNASDGEWYPFMHEMADGYDSVEWAAALPYSNGKVGMIGGSYVGATQLLAAIASPPHLVGIYPTFTASDYHEHWAYQGGAFMQMLAQAWGSALSVNVLERKTGGSAVPSHWDYMKPPSEYPVIDPGTAKGVADYYFDWIAHPAYDDYWRQWSIQAHYAQVKVPVLTVAAWYDLFQDGSLRNYVGLRRGAGTGAARAGQRLVIIPGGHAGAGQKIGDVDFGKASVLDLDELGYRWYDHLIKGLDNGIDREKPVKVFVMGTNTWRDEDDWPLARARETRFYLHSRGRANSLSGDGTLSTDVPGAEVPDTYACDPAHPVPSRGGGLLGDPASYPPGPIDQRAVEGRQDVLVYTTAAFTSDTEVTGPVSLDVYVRSSAVDTDFTGKLVDVAPDGTAINLSDGILRARYRNSMEKPELMSPGTVYRLRIELWSTANVFLKDHRLRLDVASGNFPRFDRNPNTGESPEAPGPSVVATNVILHDREHPSALILPVVP
ncbi:MAG TPA: CocE/NonD family hydrolase [Dongiaceae bacterium]|nr:CocE/NonD family hydrolase [Dongiaceae bacterium]